MGLDKNYDSDHTVSDLNFDDESGQYESPEDTERKKQVRRLIEEKLERKRLKEELEDEFDSDFDWGDFEE